MLKIELNFNPSDRWPEGDVGLRTRTSLEGLQEGDIGTFCVDGNCESPSKKTLVPNSLEEKIKTNLPDGIRAMVGNAGCEVTFRHLHGANAKKNIAKLLEWAKASYEILGDQLVLAPMDYDLIHDVMTGCYLMKWAAEHKVPLVIFCGYRFLFDDDAFDHIRIYSRKYNFKDFGNIYSYPFVEISDAIKQTNAELWTGAGFGEGLQFGVVQKAENFGFKGVLTTRQAWES